MSLMSLIVLVDSIKEQGRATAAKAAVPQPARPVLRTTFVTNQASGWASITFAALMV